MHYLLMPVPPQPPSLPDSPIERQNTFLKRAVGLLIVALLAALAGALYVRHQGQPVAILLDSKSITTARNAAAAEDLLRAAEKARVGSAYPDNSIVRLQRVQLIHLPGNPPLDTTDVAIGKLKQAIKLHVRAYAIYVNGKAALGLPTDAQATETLHRVKEHFAHLPPQAQIVSEPEFAQRVTVKEAALDAALTRPGPDAAAPYFWTAPPSRTYTVHRHDTGLVIARRYHLSLSEFIAANPGLDLNRLKPGTLVNVQKMPLLLTVQVTKQLTRDEKIIPGAPEAQAGKRSVTYAVTFINGQETGRSVLNMTTLVPPQTRTSL